MADLKILGDSNPHYFYGIDLTANYKGFDFRCFLQGVLKPDFGRVNRLISGVFVVAILNGILLVWNSIMIIFGTSR